MSKLKSFYQYLKLLLFPLPKATRQHLRLCRFDPAWRPFVHQVRSLMGEKKFWKMIRQMERTNPKSKEVYEANDAYTFIPKSILPKYIQSAFTMPKEKKIDLFLSEQTKAYFDLLDRQQKDLREWVDKNVGIPQERMGKPAQRLTK